MTAGELALKVVLEAGKPLCIEEVTDRVNRLTTPGYSANNIATRLSELARLGKIQGKVRPGTHYKEWSRPNDLPARQPDAAGQYPLL